jgi:dTDP-4-amino-4,6-dideoxygalactose transaminase
MDANTDALYNPYKYYNYLIAYNSRLDAMQAVVLSVKLKYLDEYNKNRTRIANLYDAGLKGVVATPPPPKDGVSCYHQYVIRSGQKDDLSAHLAEKGIGTGAFYPVPLHLQKAFNYLGYKEGDMPVSEMLSRETVCLPIFPELTDEEVKIVIEAVKSF